MADTEDEEEAQEGPEVIEDGNSMGRSQEEYFSWLTLVDNVAELTHDKWDDVFRKNIYEFFNLISYLRFKNEKIKERIEKWKQTH